MRQTIFSILLLYSVSLGATPLYADTGDVVRARVLEVQEERTETIPGTETQAGIQTILIEISDGSLKGERVIIENDFLSLKQGEDFFARVQKNPDGTITAIVHDRVRTTGLLFLTVLGAGIIILFGKLQGIRSLAALTMSMGIIAFVLIPALLHGYPPVPVASATAAVILALAISATHGLNRESAIALCGTASAVLITGLLAETVVSLTRLSGAVSEEAVYLNLSTQGTLDFSGLLLAGIIIGMLGVLDDIAVTQTSVVRELYRANPQLSQKEVYTRALIVGREHVGALVNTLALAYTGASLPLMLLIALSSSPFLHTINQEIIAIEIVRTIIGSIGLVLTVPITTWLAARYLQGRTLDHKHHYHA